MNKTFKKGIMISILAVVAISLFDLLSARSGIFGNLIDYTAGNFSPGWWPLFFKVNLIFLTLVPISYFFFGRRDKSEAIALFLNSIILWFFGLADILYFWLQGKMVPEFLPWLNDSPVIGKVSTLLGNEVVTSTSLYISVIGGFIIIYFLDKWLEKVN